MGHYNCTCAVYVHHLLFVLCLVPCGGDVLRSPVTCRYTNTCTCFSPLFVALIDIQIHDR